MQQLGDKTIIRGDPSPASVVATTDDTFTYGPRISSPEGGSLAVYQNGGSVAFKTRENVSTKRTAGDDFDTAGLAKIPRLAQIGEPFIFNKANLTSRLLRSAVSSDKRSRYASLLSTMYRFGLT
jgi:hypothetical protein